MKLKRILCMIVATMMLSATTVFTVFAEEPEAGGNDEPAAMTTAAERMAPLDAIASLGLENPCEVDENGNVALEEDALIDLILPKALGGQELTSISAKSFAGCPYIRSVVVPETILEIGESAFADCEFLETIYVIGHNEDDLTLGVNWNGGAEVVYVVDEVEEEKETPAEDAGATTEEQKVEDSKKEDAPAAPAESQPSDADNVNDADSSEPANSTKENAGTEEKAPADESSSDEEKGTADAQQGNNNEDSAASNDADEAASQGNEDVSAEEGDAGDAPAETSEEAES